MSEKLQIKNPIYPLIGILASAAIIVFGLVTANKLECMYFLAGVWLLFLLFGYWKSCLAVLPVAGVLCAVFSGITYAITRDVAATYAAANRILAVCVAVVPGLALSPIYLTRSLSQIGTPRMITLGMMIALNFFPLLKAEVRQIREAMRTRGAGSLLNPKIFYRAFLIPLVMRLVNISDTLALSVETRGFSTEKTPCTVYKPVRLRVVDILFALLVAAGAILTVVL